MSRPTEVDSPTVVRDGLIDIRNQALVMGNFSLAVLLSHAIAWLAYLIELEEKGTNSEKSSLDQDA